MTRFPASAPSHKEAGATWPTPRRFTGQVLDEAAGGTVSLNLTGLAQEWMRSYVGNRSEGHKGAAGAIASSRLLQPPPCRSPPPRFHWGDSVRLLRRVTGKPALQVGRLGEIQQVVGQPVEQGNGERADALLVLFGQHAQASCQLTLHRGRPSGKLAL